MKQTLMTIDCLMETQAKNALKTDSRIRFAGKTALRILRQVKETLEEELICCESCISYKDMDELIQTEVLAASEAEILESAGVSGMCVMGGCSKYVSTDDYCSFAIRETGME